MKAKSTYTLVLAVIGTACAGVGYFGFESGRKNAQNDIRKHLFIWNSSATKTRSWAENNFNIFSKNREIVTTPSKLPEEERFTVKITTEHTGDNKPLLSYTFSEKFTTDSLPIIVSESQPQEILESLSIYEIRPTSSEKGKGELVIHPWVNNVKTYIPNNLEKLLKQENLRNCTKYTFEKKDASPLFTRSLKITPKKSVSNSPLLDIHIFDSRTKVNLKRTTGLPMDEILIFDDHNQQNSIIRHLPLYHPTPVTIFLDELSPETHTSILTDDTACKIGNCEIRLIHQGRFPKIASVKRDQTNRIVKFVEKKAKTAGFTHFFVQWSDTQALKHSRLSYENSNGEKVYIPVSSEDGQLAIYSTQDVTENIDKISIEYPKHINRYKIELNELPGMPEENRGISDLFDVKIPYLTVKNGNFDAQQIIAILQLRPAIDPDYIPKKSKPFTNQSIKDILKDWNGENDEHWMILQKNSSECLFTNRTQFYEKWNKYKKLYKK